MLCSVAVEARVGHGGICGRAEAPAFSVCSRARKALALWCGVHGKLRESENAGGGL
ncbi:MAG: hypothetical protein ACP5QR_16770 [Rhizomicrobium sp.]